MFAEAGSAAVGKVYSWVGWNGALGSVYPDSEFKAGAHRAFHRTDIAWQVKVIWIG